MAIHISVGTNPAAGTTGPGTNGGSASNQFIRIDSQQPGERDGGIQLSARVEGTTSDSAAKQIVADKSGNAVAIKLPA